MRRHLFPVMILATFSSCAYVDPDFGSAEQHVSSTASRESILGMWFHGSSLGLGGEVKVRDSILFKSDGSGVMRRSGTGPEFVSNFRWSYAGSGKWKLIEGAGLEYPIVWKVAGTRLLEYMDRGVFGVRNIVYYREDDSIARHQNINR